MVMLVGCGGTPLESGGAQSGGAWAVGGAGGQATGSAGGAGGSSGCICRPWAPCKTGWWEYTGRSCDHWGSCWDYGDHLCYQSCNTDSDCTDPRFPQCSAIIRRYEADVYYYTNACTGIESVPACLKSGQDGAGGANACPSGAGGASGGASGMGGNTRPDCGGWSPANDWARWKMPNPAATGLPNPASYLDLGDGTVRDQVTGLVWQRDVSQATYEWQQAKEYCTSLNLANGTWRLPTRIELFSLVDFTKEGPGPMLDTAAFPDAPNEKFWSSTPIASSCSSACVVDFRTGAARYASVDSSESALRARCVQETTVAEVPLSHYEIASGEVLDTQTGLVWQQVSDAEGVSWSTALEKCAGLKLNDHAWRVPSIKELQTLVDDSRMGIAIDTATFTDVPHDSESNFWSSSRQARSSTQVWFSFVFGVYTGTMDSQVKYRVRCVR